MASFLQRGLLVTLGAAALTREKFTRQFQRLEGSEAEEGRQKVDELVGKARHRTRLMKSRVDGTLQRALREVGLASDRSNEEQELKIAQLEHRISLLEAAAAEKGVGEKHQAGAEKPDSRE